MSFVVEIPSVFTKATQIPVRLGNTILTGNETIQGSLSVNGSLILNSGYSVDNTNVVYYDSLDISNTLNVGGDVSISGDLVVRGVLSVPKNPAYKVFYDTVNNSTGSNVSSQKVPYNAVLYDTTSSYSIGNLNYTIPVAGKYFLSISFFAGNSAFVVDLRKNEVTVKRYQFTTQATYNTFSFSTTIDCSLNDRIDYMIASGAIRVAYSSTAAPEGWQHIEGFKLP